MSIQIATFGAGCFWHVQLAFGELPGVTKTTVGYMGGDEKKYPHPTYKLVCSNSTGYIESVQVEYDPKKVSYPKLLSLFFSEHDPTSIDRQGPDVGVQYRSVIFYRGQLQRAQAQKAIEKVSREIKKPVVTQLRPAATFFPAEEYHQNYLKKRGANTC